MTHPQNPTSPNNQVPPSQKEYQDRFSNSLEATKSVLESFKKDQPSVMCSCHLAEKKSESMSTAAAVFSFGALALSLVSLALPFLKKDDVTFDAKAWAEFLTTLEETVREASEAREEPEPAPAAALPASSKPRAVVVAAPASSRPAVVASSEASIAAAEEEGAVEEEPVEQVEEVAAEIPEETADSASGSQQ